MKCMKCNMHDTNMLDTNLVSYLAILLKPAFDLSLFEICQIEVSRGFSQIIRAMEFCKCRHDP